MGRHVLPKMLKLPSQIFSGQHPGAPLSVTIKPFTIQQLEGVNISPQSSFIVTTSTQFGGKTYTPNFPAHLI